MNLPAFASTPSIAQAQPADFQPFAAASLGVSAEHRLELLDSWRSITKRKWAILLLAAVMSLVACAIALSLTPIYRSTATLLIEAGKAKILSIEDVYSGSPQREHYQTQVEILKSREVAERTVRALVLWEHPLLDPRKAETPWRTRLLVAAGIRPASDRAAWSEDELAEAVTLLLMDAMSVDPVRASQLVKVSYESSDKALAAKVANALAEQYIAADREARFNLSQQVSAFLQERLSSLRAKLTQSEQALQAYREKRGIVSLGGSAQALASQEVNATTEKLLGARARRAELESSAQQLQAITNGDYSSSPIVMRDPAVMESARQLNDANRRLAELSETLGSRNSKVLQAESERAQIESVLAKQRAAVAASVIREYEAARSTEVSLERALGAVRNSVQDVNREEFQLAVLERDAQSNRQLYDMFMSRAKETNLASDVQASVARVVDAAVPMTVQVRPARTQLVIVTALVALLAGALASLLLDRLDNTVKGGDDAESRLRQPLLAALPAVPDSDREHMACQLLDDPHSHFSEAIRTARTGVLLSNFDRPNRIVLITSTLPGEGKTTVAINLALAHSQTKRTLLIDADMRRSQVARSLRMAPGAKGITNLVSGTAEIAECVYKLKGSELHVMPVGDVPPNPLELLLSRRFREALASLSEQFEIVIIDSPPVELVSEALVLTPLVTSTVFVVKAMSTPAPLVRKSIQRLQRAGGSILGIVVNQLDFKHAQRYYGEYGGSSCAYGGYGYGALPKAKKKDDEEGDGPGLPPPATPANASV